VFVCVLVCMATHLEHHKHPHHPQRVSDTERRVGGGKDDGTHVRQHRDNAHELQDREPGADVLTTTGLRTTATVKDLEQRTNIVGTEHTHTHTHTTGLIEGGETRTSCAAHTFRASTRSSM